MVCLLLELLFKNVRIVEAINRLCTKLVEAALNLLDGMKITIM